MNNTISFFQEIWKSEPHLILIGIFTVVVGLIAKMKLFAKADKNLWSAFIPVWDLITIMEMVGRPRFHAVYMCIPGVNIVFGLILIVELAQSFGKTTRTQKILALIFNFFYILNLALSFEEEYQGPVYANQTGKVKKSTLLNPA
jgi:signal peptidase I